MRVACLQWTLALLCVLLARPAVPHREANRGGHQLGRRLGHHRSSFGAAGGCPGSGGCGYVPLPAAPQTVYRGGVPHTDRHGRRRTEFDPSASFLPLGLCASL